MTNAYASMQGRSLASAFEAGLDTVLSRATAAWMQYRIYRRTLAELRQLPLRTLRDLDLERGDLAMIAHRAAYGR